MLEFTEAWKQIREYLNNENEVSTLVQRIPNQIVSVKPYEIKVRSKSTGVVRSIPRSPFREIWETLSTNGIFITKDHGPYIHSQIIAAIIVKAGLAKYEYNPLTLKLISQ